MFSNKNPFFTLLILPFLCFGGALKSQSVAINTTGNPANPNSILDVSANDKGLLIPRLTTAQRTGMALGGTEEGLTVYDSDTQSYWLWDGTAWVEFDMDATNEYNISLSLNGTDLELTDGGGTLNQDLSALTDTSYWDRDPVNGWLFPSNIGDDVGIGDADPESPLDVHGRAYIGGNMDAMTDNAAEIDLAIDDDEVGSNTGFEVPGNDTLTFIAGGAEQARIFPSGVMAVNTNNVITGQTFYSIGNGNDNAVLGAVGGSGAGVRGENAGGNGTGLTGIADNDQGFGAFLLNDHTSGTAILSAGNNTGATYLTAGSGASMNGTRFGAIGWGDNTADGIGLYGIGNNKPATTPTDGAGVAGVGEFQGVWGYSDSVPGGIGVIGTGNDEATQILTDGAGVGGTGTSTGVYGFATDLTDGFGGYFQGDASAFAYVGGYNGGTAYKILGMGTVSTIVKDEDEEKVTMFAPEAPEVLFEDYGQSELENGEARIELDPTWKRNVRIDEDHPLRVFIQVEGNCKGVYVTDKSADGFTVKELDKGDSDVPFTYKVVANRKDEEVPTRKGGTRTVRYEDLRFPDAPDPKEFREGKTESQEEKEKKAPEGSGMDRR